MAAERHQERAQAMVQEELPGRRRHAAFADGEIVSLGGKHPVKIINANAPAQDAYTIQAGQFHGTEDYLVQQVLVSDPHGRFPDDPQCEPRYRLPMLAVWQLRRKRKKAPRRVP